MPSEPPSMPVQVISARAGLGRFVALKVQLFKRSGHRSLNCNLLHKIFVETFP